MDTTMTILIVGSGVFYILLGFVLVVLDEQ